MGTLAKKKKELKVLDGKTAQNMLILLNGSLKHLPHQDIRQYILQCDTSVLSDNVLKQLLDYLPPADQLARFKDLRDDLEGLTEAEQFVATVICCIFHAISKKKINCHLILKFQMLKRRTYL